ncbi:hypothetical protein TVAG_366220 [Trichomonas vaginalis G3]|uniref:Uncharacterized protein n=1 Tax=Trichomonas vaginalis (strain ATCC PRA-98 / G3) TaxID=412133 RepID=A2DHR6_TRIV3|nr:hypothetical protein TVAGG3_0303290 [Trichomonas vaginalis G3]EAY20114.1 hypothetical protein TVAG_366220 [Trichomonas vaginalis G3]KAI5528067.1 hypothetical protein TVAGG3_0303290 [Trichomonas vaginalis G3]|eukprot:XP_001581100.1 hypothetical protein [Trichomonas vaginalis G3]
MQEHKFRFDAEQLMQYYQIACLENQAANKDTKIFQKIETFSPQTIRIKAHKSSDKKQQKRRYKVEPRKAVLHFETKDQPLSPPPESITDKVIVQKPFTLSSFDHHIPSAFSIIRRGNLPGLELPL